MRVIHTEDLNSLINPKENDPFELLPELLPLIGLEIERIDVLILFGWILCILDGPIRPETEPPRMICRVRMVRGTLESQVDGDSDSIFVCLGQKSPEVI